LRQCFLCSRQFVCER